MDPHGPAVMRFERLEIADRLRALELLERERRVRDRRLGLVLPRDHERDGACSARPCGTARSSADSAVPRRRWSRRGCARGSRRGCRPPPPRTPDRRAGTTGTRRSRAAAAIPRRRAPPRPAIAPLKRDENTETPPADAIGVPPVKSAFARIALVFSLASETFGSSNGLMPRIAPATAVANSQRKNSAPRPAMRVLRRSTGCPAASSASRRAASGASRSVEMATKARSSPYSSGAPSGSSTTGSAPLPCLPVLSATSCSIHRPSARERRRQHHRQLVAPLGGGRADERAELEPGILMVLLPAAFRHVARAPASISRTGAPMSAPGTRPKSDSAEKRPPMSGGLRKTFR